MKFTVTQKCISILRPYERLFTNQCFLHYKLCSFSSQEVPPKFVILSLWQGCVPVIEETGGQRKAMKMIKRPENLPYEERLK